MLHALLYSHHMDTSADSLPAPSFHTYVTSLTGSLEWEWTLMWLAVANSQLGTQLSTMRILEVPAAYPSARIYWKICPTNLMNPPL